MFPPRFFPVRFFAPRFFPPAGIIEAIFKGLQRFNLYIHQKAVIFLER